MKTGAGGLAIIKAAEGLRLRSYRDPVGILTIGYGHTSAAGAPQVIEGMTITEDEADRILLNDLIKFEAAVGRLTTREPNQNQNDAMVSLCMNIGEAKFAKSSVLRLFNEGNNAGAADAFRLWTKAKGKVLPGLVTRREAERALFLREVPYVPPRKDMAMEPTTEVPVKSAWYSKTNWTQVIAALISLAVAFGLTLNEADQVKILAAVPIVQGLVTWILRTWFVRSITPAAAARDEVGRAMGRRRLGSN